MLDRHSPFDLRTGHFARAAGWPLLVLLVLYLLPGTLQRGPWKTEDAMFFGVVWRAIESNDWLHFHLSSTLLPESPLYFWLSGATANLLQGLMPAPAAIRLATTLFVGLTFGALYLTARRLFDRPWAGLAPLTLAGCLGLLIASHDVQPMTATLAALAVLLYGISLARPTAHVPAGPLALAGAMIGLGFGGLLLASGFRLLPAALAVLAVGFVHEQRQRYALAVLAGMTIGIALFLAWWLALQDRSSDLASAWLDYQFDLLTPHLDSGRNFWINLTTLSWSAWPAWPLAGYAVWIHRQRLRSPALLGPLVMILTLLPTLSLASESRQVWLATLLPPMALLSVPALMVLRRGAVSLLDWFGRTVFALLLLVVALGWSAMHFGWPVRWAAKAARLAPGFVASLDLLALFFALTVMAGWIWTIASSQRSPQKSLFSWSGGLIAFWAAIVALWLPWFDHQRSYQGVARDIQKALGKNTDCLGVSNLSEAQFASFDYYLSNPMHRKPADRKGCRLLLAQGFSDGKTPAAGRWTLLWEGARPGDKTERYQLFARQ